MPSSSNRVWNSSQVVNLRGPTPTIYKLTFRSGRNSTHQRSTNGAANDRALQTRHEQAANERFTAIRLFNRGHTVSVSQCYTSGYLSQGTWHYPNGG